MDGTWIGRKNLSTAVNKGQKFNSRKPLFSLEMWNQVDVVMSMEEGEEMVISTNNAMESYNRTMKIIVGSKPNLWTVIQSLVAEKADTRQLLVSHRTRSLSKHWQYTDYQREKVDRILSLVKSFHDLLPGVYLRAMAANVDQDKQNFV